MLVVVLMVLLTFAAGAKEEGQQPPCAACNNLVHSLENRISGGIGSLDFDRVFKQLCSDEKWPEGQLRQCKSNKEEWKQRLREWWSLKQKDANAADLREWLCVDKLRVCCPLNHYGPDCKECAVKDEKGVLCSGNGKCKGAGTRKGNGKCACDVGYVGALCNECDAGYYESYRDEEKRLCSQCHSSCHLHCTGSGAKGCVACRSGFRMDAEHGCFDIDECMISNPCTANKFCVNTEGAYRCLNCDQACKGCDGDGPDNCNECAEGYTKRGDSPVCVSEQMASKIFTVSNVRFFTYAGLCVATCIIFQRSVAVAGILGAVVAMYISFSEYYLATSTGEMKPI